MQCKYIKKDNKKTNCYLLNVITTLYKVTNSNLMLLNEAIDKHISWHNSLALLFDTQKFEIHLSYEYIMPHNKLTFIYSS